jgi:hypothetical protein
MRLQQGQQLNEQAGADQETGVSDPPFDSEGRGGLTFASGAGASERGHSVEMSLSSLAKRTLKLFRMYGSKRPLKRFTQETTSRAFRFCRP